MKKSHPAPANSTKRTRIPLRPEDRLLTWLNPFVRHCGNPTRPPWHVGKRRIRDYLLVGIREGEGVFSIAGVDHKVGPGDLFWVPPNTEHEMRGTSDRMACPYVHFDLIYRPGRSDYVYDINEELLDLRPYRNQIHPPLPAGNPFASLKGPIRTMLNDKVIELIVAISNEAIRSQPYARWKTRGIMLELLAELLRGVEGVPARCMQHLPALERAVAYIHSRCSEKLHVEEIARFCSLSASELRRLFAEQYHCSPRALIQKARINRAKELLVEQEDLNITDVAYEVGFSCIHAFTRSFHKLEGTSPTLFRRFGTPHIHSETRWQLAHKEKGYIEKYAAVKRRMLQRNKN